MCPSINETSSRNVLHPDSGKKHEVCCTTGDQTICIFNQAHFREIPINFHLEKSQSMAAALIYGITIYSTAASGTQ